MNVEMVVENVAFFSVARVETLDFVDSGTKIVVTYELSARVFSTSTCCCRIGESDLAREQILKVALHMERCRKDGRRLQKYG